jgi:hypothetical protein
LVFLIKSLHFFFLKQLVIHLWQLIHGNTNTFVNKKIHNV